MTFHVVQTTIRPGEDLIVDDAEYAGLLELGLLVGSAPSTVPVFDQGVADLVEDPDSATRVAIAGLVGGVGSVNGQTGVVTLDADDIGDGTAKVLMTAAERAKLDGIADGATANASDAQLRDRENHTGTQTASTISDLTETVLGVAEPAIPRSSAAAGATAVLQEDGSLALRSAGARPLADFYEATDPTWTNAFAFATSWSSSSGRQVYVPEAGFDYTTAAPIVLNTQAQFIGSVRPTWTGLPAGYRPSTVIRPTADFPSNRGLFEVGIAGDGSAGRGTALSGLALRGYQVGTSVHGVLFPGITGTPELGTDLYNLDVHDFSGDGLRGGARMIFLDKVFTHENTGWGVNINDPWNDSSVDRLWSFYNKAGGLTIDAPAARLEFSKSRFDRSGQPAYVATDQTNPNWNPTAPGVRIRASGSITFSQCGTDANNGPGVLGEVTSATPLYLPWGVTWVAGTFMRDGQGGGTVASPASTGVKVRGFAFTGGQTVGRWLFDHCTVSPGQSGDGGGGTPSNPGRAVWLENTEFCSWIGGEPAGDTSRFYFGPSADPATANYRLNIDIPQLGIKTPVWPDTPPFQTAGMLRDSGTALQRSNGTSFVTV